MSLIEIRNPLWKNEKKNKKTNRLDCAWMLLMISGNVLSLNVWRGAHWNYKQFITILCNEKQVRVFQLNEYCVFDWFASKILFFIYCAVSILADHPNANTCASHSIAQALSDSSNIQEPRNESSSIRDMQNDISEVFRSGIRVFNHRTNENDNFFLRFTAIFSSTKEIHLILLHSKWRKRKGGKEREKTSQND